MRVLWVVLLLLVPIAAKAQLAGQLPIDLESIAYQLGLAEIRAGSLQAQLNLANRQIEDLKARCGDPCKIAEPVKPEPPK